MKGSGKETTQPTGLVKYLFLVLGSACLAIGMIGIFLPILPTTPFLLLASFFYLRSSKRMHGWLMGHRIFGPYLYCYIHFRAIPGKTKAGALVFLWIALGISMIFVPSLTVRILLLLVGAGVTAHLLLLRTLNPGEKDALNQQFNQNNHKNEKLIVDEQGGTNNV